MSTAQNNVLHAFWGSRPEPLELTAQRISESLDVLDAVRTPSTGEWTGKDGSPLVRHSSEAFVFDLQSGVARDSAGDPIPDAGYTAHYYLGEWSRPQGDKVDLGKFDVNTGGDHPLERGLAASVVVSFKGAELCEAAREHAQSLVTGFAKAWQPDFVSFTDHDLLGAGPRLRRYPTAAYAAWLSDGVSRDLEQVDNATTTRFGAGTLVSISADASGAAAVWQSLVAAQRIRAAEPKQDEQPQFSN